VRGPVPHLYQGDWKLAKLREEVIAGNEVGVNMESLANHGMKKGVASAAKTA
jgi:hypothetical protein